MRPVTQVASPGGFKINRVLACAAFFGLFKVHGADWKRYLLPPHLPLFYSSVGITSRKVSGRRYLFQPIVFIYYASGNPMGQQLKIFSIAQLVGSSVITLSWPILPMMLQCSSNTSQCCYNAAPMLLQCCQGNQLLFR